MVKVTADKSIMNKQLLRIIVMGYYGHLNAGDDLLQQAMTYIFQDHKLMFTSWFPGTLVLNECDLVVVGGGSIWPGFAVFQQAEEVAKRLKVPLFVMGISAKKQDDSVKRGTLRLIDRAEYFHVRDFATLAVFDEHPKVKAGVDLFWWMPWSNYKINKHNERATSVALNLREWRSMNWSPQDIVSAIQDASISLNALPLYFGSSIHDSNINLNDAQLLEMLGLANVPNHWTYQPIVDSDICVAMRYHAILLSTRMEKPVIGFNYHPKIISFFEDNEIPELCVSLDKPAELKTAIRMVSDNYKEYVSRFSDIKNRLEQAGQNDLEECRKILSSIVPANHSGIVKRVMRAILARL